VTTSHWRENDSKKFPLALATIMLLWDSNFIPQHPYVSPIVLARSRFLHFKVLNDIRFLNICHLLFQVFYLTTESSNSFEIVKKTVNEEESALSICANQVALHKGQIGSSSEVSCYTGVLARLQQHDTLQLHQIEQNRLIIFNQGFSHWGIVRMQSR